MILNENIFLNEAFSNIPDWLKQYLAFQSEATNYSSKEKKFNGRNSRNSKRSSRSGGLVYNGEIYIIKQGHFSDRKSNELYWKQNKYIGRMSNSNGLLNSFRAAGIDVANMNVIETDVPEKGSDPRLKEPNIPIFLLYDNFGEWDNAKGICQVYAKGINDDEICEFSFEKNDKRLGKIPTKFLLDKCIAFGYIDGSDENNYMSEEEIDRRIQRDNENPNTVPYERLPKDFVKFRGDDLSHGYSVRYKDSDYRYSKYSDYSGNLIDKSGYVKQITPSDSSTYSRWYSKFRDKEKQKKYDRMKEASITNIEDLENTYKNLRDEYKSVLRYSSWLDSVDKFDKGRERDLNLAKDKIEDLKDRIDKIKEYKSRPGNEDTTLSSDNDWVLEDDLKYCNNLRKEIKSIFNGISSSDNEYSEYADLDWD